MSRISLVLVVIVGFGNPLHTIQRRCFKNGYNPVSVAVETAFPQTAKLILEKKLQLTNISVSLMKNSYFFALQLRLCQEHLDRKF